MCWYRLNQHCDLINKILVTEFITALEQNIPNKSITKDHRIQNK